MFLIKQKKYYYFEQDTYNIVLNDKVKYLHPKYNYIIDTWKLYGDKKCSEILGISVQEGESLYENTVIYHLASPKKPWVYKNGLMRDVWIKYFNSSPFSSDTIGDAIYKWNQATSDN